MGARLLGALAVVLCALPAGEAAAQDCPAPAIEGFQVAHEEVVRTGEPERFIVEVSGAASVTMAWPDGTSSTVAVRGERAVLRHTFRETGRQRVVATATGPCGAPASGALTVPVHAPCDRARDASVSAADCDTERGLLDVGQAGLRTMATWLTWPCRDVLYPPTLVPPEPVARAAACEAPPYPPEVAGRLPVRSNSVLALRVGVPARRVLVALGGPRRARTPFERAGRVGRSGRSWRIRVARLQTSTRLWVRVDRAGGGELFVAGVRPRG